MRRRCGGGCWRKFFILKPCELSATTGWCGTTSDISRCKRKPGIMRRPRAKSRCEWEDGRLQIRYRARAVSWEEIPGPVPAQAERPNEAKAKKLKPPTPSANHPWRQHRK